MRILLILATLLPLSAAAQVATDDHALDSLGTAPAPAKPAPKPAKTRPAAHGSGKRQPVHPAGPRTPGQVRVPDAPPANPVLAPPPFVMPPHAPPPPPPVPVRADAPGSALPIPKGLRVMFGAGSSELNPGMLAAIRSVAAQAMADPALQVAITAWAPGTPDDPSTPRRLSLERALAVRAVLINAGMVSERIRAVAKGPVDAVGGPLDRADVLVTVPK